MLAKPSPLLTRLLDRLEKMPVIDCHEHLAGPYAGLDSYKEPIAFLSLMYMINDLWKAAGCSNSKPWLRTGSTTTPTGFTTWDWNRINNGSRRQESEFRSQNEETGDKMEFPLKKSS